MANRANDPQFDFKAPEENRQKYEPKKWEKKAFQGVSPMDFYVRQNNEKKKVKEREAAEKAARYKYQAKGLSDEEAFAKKVNTQHDKEKQAAREEIERAKHVTVTATAETEIRKDQFDRDQGWKQKQREQKAENNNFDMARSLFGGAGEEEEEEEVEE
ncbi:expressed unknown protein [Seminavis robusta]|uniref:Uncharacterized protein n=1 Tax=Seminavis robusta TaxID=568900 RepID=A0A9N8DHE6_9STRA|nr:expressed unknown protein [Seminavis robusta]|eukprot:Sro128_g061380.1 n/a (158) ;mRNA; f:97605-98078